uniref:Ras-related protein Rab-4B n=1 Tax=Anthurium amnicola TaxID=1678845 RepID=A0A1D1ZGY0_9ARAE
MEEAAAADGLGPLEAIRPPRLEDAGLEDSALPPEAIQEAFLKAASSVPSRVINPGDDDEEDGRCVEDPFPINGEVSDAPFATGEVPAKPRRGDAPEEGSLPPAGEDLGGGDGMGVVVGSDPGEVVGEHSSEEACVGEDVRRGRDELSPHPLR